MSPPGRPKGEFRSAQHDGSPASAAFSLSAARPVALADIGRGFADPVHGAQQVFRAVLEAMARPGRLQALPARALQGLETESAGRGLAAVLLALLDGETSAWLSPSRPGAVSPDFLRFHTGVRLAAHAAGAAFVIIAADEADAALWTTLNSGTDEAPQHGATMVVVVPALSTPEHGQAGLRCRGPGIADTHELDVGGIAPAFWHARERQAARLPRGIDLILVCGDTLAALPRSTRLEGIA